MIDCQAYGILQILGSTLTGEPRRLPVNFSLEKAKETIALHQIYSMTYFGALACGIPKDQPAMTWLFDKTCKSIAIDERQKALLEMLISRFEAEHIDYLLLKGTVLKQLYPQPDMRMMSDADILIRKDQYDKIAEIMTREGFTPGTESDHELVWKKPGFLVELHKRLVPTYDKDLYAYYGEGWDFAVPVEEGACRYELVPEDLLVYLIVHAAKHYRDGGIGIKHFCDLWLFRKKHPKVDMDYVRGELKRLNLLRFYENVERTLAAWFDHQPMTEEADLITARVFASGAYGTKEMQNLSDAAKRSEDGDVARARLSKTKEMLFPSYSNMCILYPKLKKMPPLLPAFWCARWCRTLFFRRDRIHSNIENIRNMEEESIQKYREELEKVGLPLEHWN